MSKTDKTRVEAFKALFEGYELASVTPEPMREEAALLCRLVFEKPKSAPQTVLAIFSAQAAPAFYAHAEAHLLEGE